MAPNLPPEELLHPQAAEEAPVANGWHDAPVNGANGNGVVVPNGLAIPIGSDDEEDEDVRPVNPVARALGHEEDEEVDVVGEIDIPGVLENLFRNRRQPPIVQLPDNFPAIPINEAVPIPHLYINQADPPAPNSSPLDLSIRPPSYINDNMFSPFQGVDPSPHPIPTGPLGVPLLFTYVSVPAQPFPILFPLPLPLFPILDDLLEEAELEAPAADIPTSLNNYVLEYLEMSCVRGRIYRNRHNPLRFICGSCLMPEDADTFIEEVDHHLQSCRDPRMSFCERCGISPYRRRSGTQCRYCMAEYFRGDNREVIHVDYGSLHIIEPPL